MHEYGVCGHQAVDRLHGLADPLESGRDGGYRDIGAWGSQAAEGMLRA
jgi:hypothetical protein